MIQKALYSSLFLFGISFAGNKAWSHAIFKKTNPNTSCAKHLHSSSPNALLPQIKVFLEELPDLKPAQEKIKSLYGKEHPRNYIKGRPRFFDHHLQLFYPPRGESLIMKKSVPSFVEFQLKPGDYTLIAFHRLSMEDYWINYVAINGIGLVQVKALRGPRLGETNDALKQETLRVEKGLHFLSEQGLLTPNFFGVYHDAHQTSKTLIVMEYIHGLRLKDLESLLNKKQISQQQFSMAADELSKIMEKIKKIQKSSIYKLFLKENKLSSLLVTEDDFIYSNGKWVLTSIH
ncbi:MAG: hypothetical protein D6797_08735 [Bdellovibrio sp.]|nr:MAG: hypothetical protein D6797_08735 [Bdellovibrio sp.]